MRLAQISFETILPYWEEKLWPGRQSAIETHSAMTWPYDGTDQEIDMNIFSYDATFWAVYDNKRIVGVNSGHRTTDDYYRSRGIWVETDYRKRGVATMLFEALQQQAKQEEAMMLWSMPRESALRAYTRFGFEPVGPYIPTETSDSNIYARKYI